MTGTATSTRTAAASDGRSRRPVRGGRALRRGLVLATSVLALVLAAHLAVRAGGERDLRDAEVAIGRGDGAGALRSLDAAGGSSVDVLRLRARAQLARGDLAAASAALRDAVAKEPNRWELHQDLAVVLRRAGDRPAAAGELSRAIALNPRLVLPPGFAERRRR